MVTLLQIANTTIATLLNHSNLAPTEYFPDSQNSWKERKVMDNALPLCTLGQRWVLGLFTATKLSLTRMCVSLSSAGPSSLQPRIQIVRSASRICGTFSKIRLEIKHCLRRGLHCVFAKRTIICTAKLRGTPQDATSPGTGTRPPSFPRPLLSTSQSKVPAALQQMPSVTSRLSPTHGPPDAPKMPPQLACQGRRHEQVATHPPSISPPLPARPPSPLRQHISLSWGPRAGEQRTRKEKNHENLNANLES